MINQVFDIPGVEIGIMPFAGGALSPTQKCDDYVNRVNCRDGFVPPDIAIASVESVGEGAGTTDFLSTLNSVVAFLASDMSSSNGDALQNARYSVIFLSDGLPDSDGTFDPVGTCRDAADWERAGKTIENSGVVTADHRDRFRFDVDLDRCNASDSTDLALDRSFAVVAADAGN